jgi:hypothetical protein
MILMPWHIWIQVDRRQPIGAARNGRRLRLISISLVDDFTERLTGAAGILLHPSATADTLNRMEPKSS